MANNIQNEYDNREDLSLKEQVIVNHWNKLSRTDNDVIRSHFDLKHYRNIVKFREQNLSNLLNQKRV